MSLSRLFTLFAGLLLAATVSAHSFKLGALELGHPWSRAMPEASPTGAAYLSIKNTGKEADTLLSVSTPRADKAELHVHLNDNGVMRMRQVESVAVAAGAEVKFAPGGYHIMLMGLKQPLKAGDHFPLTLKFAKAGTVTVDVIVEKDAPMAMEH
ncbi:MAG: copper chaperone PCu(A)C [Aquitalea sp.]|nr:copper chaperone PCu(A)C [Aquitalea sp.]